MTLTLRAVSLNDHPLTQPITAHFDAEGGSVGRADHNTLALPDPERHISRQHAEISSNGEVYLIKNVGSANPIIVRGQPLARGESAPLLNRDQVRIGGYLLEVIQEDAPDTEATTVVRHRAVVDALTPGVARRTTISHGGGHAPRTATPNTGGGLGDLGAPLSSSNPFAGLLGDTPPAASGVPASSQAWAPEPPPKPRALLPDDFDPFAPSPSPAPRADAFTAPPQPESRGGGAFDDLIPSSAPASIDQMFDLQRANPRDPLADFMADAMPKSRGPSEPDAIGGGKLSTDPMVLFGSPTDARSVDVPLGSADNVPELRAAFSPPMLRDPVFTPPPAPPRPAPPPPAPPSFEAPRPIPAPLQRPQPMATMRPQALSPSMPSPSMPSPSMPSPSMPPPSMPSASMPAAAPVRPQPAAGNRPLPAQGFDASAASSADPAWHGDPQELWRAFCEGAGVSVDLPQGLNPDLMRVVGGLLRSAVSGTLQLMKVRATAKHELRAQVTMIQARNNNPLKFSPDARSALEQLLQPPMRGFLDGPAAMTDAVHDLVGHTIGTMAGTRAALEGVLDRFTPEQLEAKLGGGSMLDSVLPMNRKAKLWELYLQHFESIRNEAHEDFHSLFGRAFLAAYEQQLDRLHAEEQARKG